MKKLQRVIEKELEKKRTKGKRSLSVCSNDENSLGRVMSTIFLIQRRDATFRVSDLINACFLLIESISFITADDDKSKTLLTDIIKSNIEGESEILQAVMDSTIETIDNVCTSVKEILDHPKDSFNESKGIGKISFC